jgi:hypothetical protein
MSGITEPARTHLVKEKNTRDQSSPLKLNKREWLEEEE